MKKKLIVLLLIIFIFTFSIIFIFFISKNTKKATNVDDILLTAPPDKNLFSARLIEFTGKEVVLQSSESENNKYQLSDSLMVYCDNEQILTNSNFSESDSTIYMGLEPAPADHVRRLVEKSMKMSQSKKYFLLNSYSTENIIKAGFTEGTNIINRMFFYVKNIELCY